VKTARFRPRSLRARLLVITMALLVTGIAISDTVVTSALRDRLVSRVDSQLVPLAQVVSRISTIGPIPVQGPAAQSVLSRLDLVNDVAVAYVDADGTVERTARTAAAGAEPAAPAFGGSLLRARPGVGFAATGTDGSPWRMVVVPRPGGGVVAVAGSLAETDATITELRLICLITALVLTALLTAAGWLAIRAGLRPLHSIERTAKAIADGDLAHRIPSDGPPDTEVARLTGVLNAMLAQIERAFAVRAESEARMRRFVADVSHELRTPLFGIKGSAELHLMGGGAEPGDVGRAMRRIDTEAGRLAALVEDLLLLARLDEPAAGPLLDLAPADLRTLAADARNDLRALDPGRPVRLTAPGTGGEEPAGPSVAAPVLADEARLRQVVVNLVGNVQAHTPPSSPVRIGVGCVGGEAVLEIADSGPGLTAEQIDRVFERFYRAEGSRSRAGGSGAGLGLSIVRSLVTAHGGRVEVRSTPGHGATFRLCLPRLNDGGNGWENSQNRPGS
jgi:two-component system OmpR family sensor kinase